MWTKRTPPEEGWYWMRYRGGRRQLVQCPAFVTHLMEGVVVVSARNDSFFEGPHHGGPGLKHKGKLDRSVRFGPRIEEPEEG